MYDRSLWPKNTEGVTIQLPPKKVGHHIMYNASTFPGANSHLPAMATFVQWPVNSVPWVAVAERLDCNHLIFTDVTIHQKSQELI